MTGCLTHVAQVNGRTLVRIVGELDLATAPRLEETLALFDGPILVDCARLEFIDATGLKVLANAAHEHNGLTLQNASPMLARLVRLTELEDVLCLDGSTPEGPASV
jgi:anti-sigma B factor antagonist